MGVRRTETTSVARVTPTTKSADAPGVAAQDPQVMGEGDLRGLRLEFGVEDYAGGAGV